jgi:hypothetical protein
MYELVDSVMSVKAESLVKDVREKRFGVTVSCKYALHVGVVIALF